MQSAVYTSRAPVLGRVQQCRPQRSARLVCRAQANPGQSLIGCHSQVWVGGWDRKDILRSVEGTKNAGFDLIEGSFCLLACLTQSPSRPITTRCARKCLRRSLLAYVTDCSQDHHLLSIEISRMVSAYPVSQLTLPLHCAVNVSVPEEMDAKLTKDIISEYGLKCSASMV